MREYDLYIDGAWVKAGSDERLPVIDPATGQEVTNVAAATTEDVGRAVAAASQAFEDGRWSRFSHAERARVLLKVADLIEQRLMELSEIESIDAGKPIKTHLELRRAVRRRQRALLRRRRTPARGQGGR